jgi:hypothetical protein
MDADEPNDRDRRLEQLRADLDKAHAELMGAIREDLAAGVTPSRIGRHAGWTREYIGKIRDGKAGGPLRRRSS